METTMASGSNVERLLAEARGGNREAFAELVEPERLALEAFVRSRLGAAVALELAVEDVLQETLLRAFQAVGKFECRGPESFKHWLRGIARHVIWEAASRVRRRPRTELKAEPAADHTPGSRMLRRDERFDRLQEALDTLSPEHREVILLVRVEGLPIHEVSRRLNRTPHAVSNLLLRASRKLRERFGDTESLSLPVHRRLKGTEDRRGDG